MARDKPEIVRKQQNLRPIRETSFWDALKGYIQDPDVNGALAALLRGTAGHIEKKKRRVINTSGD